MAVEVVGPLSLAANALGLGQSYPLAKGRFSFYAIKERTDNSAGKYPSHQRTSIDWLLLEKKELAYCKVILIFYTRCAQG